MINLDSFNSRSPYKATSSGTDGFYDIVTDFGVKYSIGFMQDDAIIADNAYQFIISNVNHKPSPSDDKIKQVVLIMIDEFFRERKNVLLYICETGDGKQAMRNRLFQYWFSQYECNDEYTFLSSSVKDEDGVINYATLIIRNDNPKLLEVVNEFTQTIQLLSVKP